MSVNLIKRTNYLYEHNACGKLRSGLSLKIGMLLINFNCILGKGTMEFSLSVVPDLDNDF